MNTTNPNQPHTPAIQEMRAGIYTYWVDGAMYDDAPEDLVEAAKCLHLLPFVADLDTEAGLRYFVAVTLAYADLILSAAEARAEAEALDWADNATGSLSRLVDLGDPEVAAVLDEADAAGAMLRHTTVVELPAPDSVWYLFQNPDLRVRVVASNADAVFYTDVRTEGLNREARRALPKEAFETKTQPLFHFLAAATPEVSDAH